LFDSSGHPINLPAGVTRQKPDIAGPDGGSDTFLGFALGAGGSGSCSNSASYPNFFGTSAATPHVAATAALLLQQSPGMTVSALYSALKSGAQTTANATASNGCPNVNFTGGYGFIQQAPSALPSAPAVTLNLCPDTITLGQSATLSWTATDATSCSASGAWNGAQPVSGYLELRPSSPSATPTPHHETQRQTHAAKADRRETSAAQQHTLNLLPRLMQGFGNAQLDGTNAG
jgi:subtilisin family serine protease